MKNVTRNKNITLLTIALALATYVAQAQEQSFTTIHQAFAQIGMRVSGFGGAFVDEDKDTMYAYLVPGQPGDAASLDAAITDVMGSWRPPQHQLTILPGEYTFLELLDWYDHMNPLVLSTPGVVLTGIDEATDRLRVGVGTPEATMAVAGELAVLGIPTEAVDIEQVGPVQEEVLPRCPNMDPGTLRAKWRPVLGGIQIMNDGRPGHPKDIGCSTVGAVAVKTGGTPFGFITDSHNGNVEFRNTGTVFSQPVNGAGAIATETNNPPLVPNIVCANGATGQKDACPKNEVCRCSDSLFATLDNGIRYRLGFIAKPPVLGSDKWNGSDVFKIVAKGPYLVGVTVNKVGRSTGWTSGKITSTCVDAQVNFPDASEVVKCLDEADYASGPGDSGSPVFHIDPSRGGVGLTGLHRGSYPRNGVAYKLFSEIGLVMDPTTELGPLFVCAMGQKPAC